MPTVDTSIDALEVIERRGVMIGRVATHATGDVRSDGGLGVGGAGREHLRHDVREFEVRSPVASFEALEGCEYLLSTRHYRNRSAS
jgi:hypothetical protein